MKQEKILAIRLFFIAYLVAFGFFMGAYIREHHLNPTILSNVQTFGVMFCYGWFTGRLFDFWISSLKRD